MKSLLEQSQELADKVDRITNRERDVQVANSLSVVADSVANHLARSQLLATHLSVMLNAGVADSGHRPSPVLVGSLLKKIEAVRKRLKENRANLRQGNTWANCDNEAVGLTKTLEVDLASCWQRFVSEHVTDTSSFTTFRHVPACAGGLKKVDALNGELQVVIPVLPTSAKEIAAVVAIAAKARELIGKLRLGGVPPAVEAFLKNSATGGTPLSELSDEVLEWLRKHDEFLAALRVTAASY